MNDSKMSYLSGSRSLLGHGCLTMKRKACRSRSKEVYLKITINCCKENTINATESAFQKFSLKNVKNKVSTELAVV